MAFLPWGLCQIWIDKFLKHFEKTENAERVSPSLKFIYLLKNKCQGATFVMSYSSFNMDQSKI